MSAKIDIHKKIDWIGVDWGTTNLRAYAMSADNDLVDHKQTKQGMNMLEPHEFEVVLIRLIEPWLEFDQTKPVYACGMVGAKQGWKEAEYRQVPCSPLSRDNLTDVKTSDARIRVQILPGLCQSFPADVMRGEETQIAGFLKDQPDYSGVICLPGTHSKWVLIKNGFIEKFQTFMTGEIFSLLSEQSVLRHSLSNGLTNDLAFLEAAKNAAANPDYVPRHLFNLRAAALLENQDDVIAGNRLSGMLIGQEIRAAKEYWYNHTVVVIGTPNISDRYQMVFGTLDIEIRKMDSTYSTRLGLISMADARRLSAV